MSDPKLKSWMVEDLRTIAEFLVKVEDSKEVLRTIAAAIETALEERRRDLHNLRCAAIDVDKLKEERDVLKAKLDAIMESEVEVWAITHQDTVVAFSFNGWAMSEIDFQEPWGCVPLVRCPESEENDE